MGEESSVIREYRDSDFTVCETLVSNAWEFEKNFKPIELARLAKYLYTMGSVSGSNFHKVIEVHGEVVGFLFGLNENAALPKKNIALGLGIMRRLLFLRGMAFKEKIALLKAMNTHEVNRYKLVGRGKSEIVLFIVSPVHHGKGYGKSLLSEFTGQCNKSDVKTVIVETNKLGASSFYEGVGFKLIGNFYSPLHEYTTKDGQACMYEYTL